MCVVTPFEGWVRYLREQEKRRILCAKPETLTAPELQARKDEVRTVPTNWPKLAIPARIRSVRFSALARVVKKRLP